MFPKYFHKNTKLAFLDLAISGDKYIRRRLSGNAMCVCLSSGHISEVMFNACALRTSNRLIYLEHNVLTVYQFIQVIQMLWLILSSFPH